MADLLQQLDALSRGARDTIARAAGDRGA